MPLIIKDNLITLDNMEFCLFKIRGIVSFVQSTVVKAAMGK